MFTPPQYPSTPTTPKSPSFTVTSSPNKTMKKQQQEVDAWHQNRRNNQVLQESRKTTSVSRRDHSVMVKVLVNEAFLHDPNRTRNKAKWKKMLEDVTLEFRGSSMFAVGPDPYNSCLSKLSSMMLWNTENVRVWPLKYNENEMTRRRAAQLVVLSQLRARKTLFL